MAKKDVAKKMASKEKKTSGLAKPVKTKLVKAKAPPKTQKKPTRAQAKTETTFRLEAPQAAQVFIVGCFNEWDPMANALECDGDGMWACTLSFEPGEYEF